MGGIEYYVSIHAPARRATSHSKPSSWPRSRFQSTPPHGGRQDSTNPCRSPGTVSIHAPARRATRYDVPAASARAGVSIHAPARRATSMEAVCIARPPRFQSTPPHGGRPVRPAVRSMASSCFNPRPRTEGDTYLFHRLLSITVVSIHAPARRATYDRLRRRTRLHPFQSTPPHGGRLGTSTHSPGRRLGFQSTPPHGGRQTL